MASSMFLDTIRSEGLAHLSYLIGHDGKAAVIDPRRDCRIYIEKAFRHGAKIECIFETHRNEDYFIGSVELAELTGAEIYHGKQLKFRYGNSACEGDSFDLGDLTLKIIETPGHTFESLSIAVIDRGSGNDPIGVFTGDTLFSGDVGRTDFFPDRAEEVAGLLYESIFDKLLPLGDHVILFPAHGAGSVCGEGMSEREFSTLGYEKRFNPALRRTDRKAFIDWKINEHHYQPPYFRQMEKYNLRGKAAPLHGLPVAPPLDVDEFEEKVKQGALILDARSPEAIGGALIPGSLGIPLEMIPSFAGWFLPYDRDIVLVLHQFTDSEKAVRYLHRLGYDRIAGFLDEGLFAWETSGRPYHSIPAIHAEDLVRRVNAKGAFTLLDVRKTSEVSQGRLPGAVHIYVGELPDKLDQIPKDRPVVTFCGSGMRAIIAATILKKNGFDEVENALGSMAACAAVGCPIVKDDD
jgi:hydroxyacylglutathione hydrolase